MRIKVALTMIVVVLASVLATGCAPKRHYVVLDPQNPEHAQVLQNMQFQQDARLEENRKNAGLSCPSPEDYNRVVIQDNALPARWLYTERGWLDVINPHTVPVDISSANKGVVVRNLCPFGRVSIGDANQGIFVRGSKRVVWTARAAKDTGCLGVDRSPILSLSGSGSRKPDEEKEWVIKLECRAR